ncbi:hypothetical protein DVJ78_17100 [Humibacter sp. BT305]|nr:hypothetical protein DVJ78_17100 [Humibacter sp. BT305]
MSAQGTQGWDRTTTGRAPSSGFGRAFLWLLAIPAGAGVGVLFWIILLARSRDVPLWLAALIGAGLGVVVAGTSIANRWQRHVRQQAIAARHPGAVVVDAVRVREDAGVFSQVIRTQASAGYAVAFDDAGMHVFDGGSDAQSILDVAWPYVLGFTEESLAINDQARRPGLAVRFATSTVPVVLPFAVAGAPGFPAGTRGIAALRSVLEEMRARYGGSPAGSSAGSSAGSLVGSTPSAPWGQSAAYATPTRRRVVARPSSAIWTLVSRILGGLAALAVVVTVVFNVGSFSLRWRWVGGRMLDQLLWVSIVLVAAAIVVLIVRRVVAGMETRAGYTVSRLGPASLDQVDPRTGYVLRPAGTPQLSEQQERAALARVRSLA